MSFRVGAPGVDVEDVMRQVRRRIEEKKKGVLTEAEVREIADHRLEPVLDAHDLKSGLLPELLEKPSRWNFDFDPETIYRSSRGGLLESVRRMLRPIQKLFWNPTPMISALSRQKDLNQSYVHLLHNLTLEVTRLNLEVRELKNRSLQLQGRLEAQDLRSKTLESMVVYREVDDPAVRPEEK